MILLIFLSWALSCEPNTIYSFCAILFHVQNRKFEIAMQWNLLNQSLTPLASWVALMHSNAPLSEWQMSECLQSDAQKHTSLSCTREWSDLRKREGLRTRSHAQCKYKLYHSENVKHNFNIIIYFLHATSLCCCSPTFPF